MTREDMIKLQPEIDRKSAEEVICWAFETFGADQVAIATSFGAEDQVLTDIALKENPKAQLFTLDTGRVFPETYDAMDATRMKYKTRIEALFPNWEEVEQMVLEKGPNLFYDSVENRKECCRIRKVVPLQRKLRTLTVWITGLRREQSVTRTDIHKIEWDEANGLIKLNPLADWTETQVWDYIKTNKVPYNKLHDKGYPSIGCQPCTRPVADGEDVRSGRWWWENPEHKECGLHKQ